MLTAGALVACKGTHGTVVADEEPDGLVRLRVMPGDEHGRVITDGPGPWWVKVHASRCTVIEQPVDPLPALARLLGGEPTPRPRGVWLSLAAARRLAAVHDLAGDGPQLGALAPDPNPGAS